MKSGWSILIALLLFLSIGSSVVAAEPTAYAVTFNGIKNAALAPQIKNGTTYVSMIPLFTALNTTISIDNKKKTIVGKRGNKTFTMTVGSKSAKLNGAAITLEQPPMLIKNSVYVPVRLAEKLIGAEVEMNASTKTINIRSYAIDLTIKNKLPLNNDKNLPITLQHSGNMKLKWSFKDESPFQHYTGYVGPNRTLIFKGFGDRIDTDYNGRKVYEEPYKSDSGYNFDAQISSAGYTIIARSEEDLLRWSNIDLYLDSNVSPAFYVDNEPSFDWLNINAAIDMKGNLIVLTTEGLAAYNAKGERLWVRKGWSTKDGTLSAFEGGLEISVDSANRLYIQNSDGYAIVDSKGEALLAAKGYFHPEITSDDLLLTNGNSYRFVDGQLKVAGSPFGDGTTGNYVSLERENSLKLMDKTWKKPLWVFEQSLKEKSRGYSLFSSTLVVDLDGNAYISTTGGTVYSFNQAGKMRFILNIDNSIISSTQIIPLSSTTFVAIDNNTVMCFEVAK
ncbi:copper amine oxidase N-terminal domain-containing protein [Paenibacillus glycanilyticus]|uniref:Copper amine oxidase-like N-terminal domain-containing protein n=1 Tax=Paenibacillus glycanilyticus TaxID=126569 RepID=A0ABQ6GE04_9BACL|nr:copper amine oxidase N-terminal domain-containing protein [Paenibacillus glycanilyticus]GLX67473.1 hypothetical protein MU1_18180 [Paenibacillus glycanilyticus]